MTRILIFLVLIAAGAALAINGYVNGVRKKRLLHRWGSGPVLSEGQRAVRVGWLHVALGLWMILMCVLAMLVRSCG